MKVVILAGGFGTRISEESYLKPKPMIEVGEAPILWHIMKYYSHYGFNDFIICCGYKGYVIKEYFADYYLHNSNVTFDFSSGNHMTIHDNVAEPWKVTLIDTGLNTMTGGRVRRIKQYIENQTFMLTYGDGVSNVNLNSLVEFHKNTGGMVTLTTVQPEGRFGKLDIGNAGLIHSFREKSKDDGGWINGGFMVVEPQIFDMIHGDQVTLEREPFETIAESGKMAAYKHDGFWQCMDTQRDKQLLDSLWNSGKAPWKVW